MNGITRESARQVSTGPRLILKIADGDPRRFTAAAIDDPMVLELSQLAQATPGPIQLKILDLPHWPDDSRWKFLTFVKQLGTRCQIHVGDIQFADPFRAVLAMMVGTADLAGHRNSVRAAKEAAALFCGDMSAMAAGMIRDRLVELGVRPERCDSMAKDIRSLAGKSGANIDAEGAGAHALAGRFVQHVREELHLKDPDQPAVLYHRSELYVWALTKWIRVEDDRIRAQITSFLQTSNIPEITRKLVEDVISNLKGLTLLDQWDMDLPFYIDPPQVARRNWISCSNGIVDLDLAVSDPASALRLHDSRFFSTISLPFDFDQTAQCPHWDQFRHQVLPPSSPQDRRQQVLQEFIGYTLVCDCRLEKMLAMHGPARAGKSTVVRVWQAMLGEGNISNTPFDQLGEEFRLGDLRDKAANFSSELDHLGKAREALLKQLISGEPIRINLKHKPTVEMQSHAKLIVACNTLPTIVDTSDGFWRRLIVIPFFDVVPVDQVNVALAADLISELPGIFNWALRGLKRLLENQRFTECIVCQQAAGEHRRTCDSVTEFFSLCCRRNPHVDVHSQRLYEVYAFFCRERGRKPVSESEFGKRFKALGLSKRRAGPAEDVHRPTLYRGLVLVGPGAEWMERYLLRGGVGWDNLHYDALPSTGQTGQGAVTVNPSHPDGATPDKVSN
jgi:putative DNA primase/helicase